MIYNYWVKGSTIDLENQRNFVFDKEWKKIKVWMYYIENWLNLASV